MIRLNVKHTVIYVSNLDTLVEGNINSIFLQFAFSEEWDTLVKVAVFTNGSTNVSVSLDSNICSIPWEILANQGNLYVSLRGIGRGGELVICTKNEFLGRVQPSSANGNFVDAEEATPTVIDTLIADVAELKQSGGSGEAGDDGADGKSAYELALDNGFEGTVAEWLASLKGADGAKWFMGNDYPAEAKSGDLWLYSGISPHTDEYSLGDVSLYNGTTWLKVCNIRGEQGANGHTPVKGTDYWTDADMQDIVNAVLAALPTWEGGSY